MDLPPRSIFRPTSPELNWAASRGRIWRPCAPCTRRTSRTFRSRISTSPLGRGIRLDLESIQAKLVRGGRGGYCFEHNALLAAALEAIGFPVTRLSARVRSGRTRASPAHPHAAQSRGGRRVLDLRRWIWRLGIAEPIPLVEGTDQRQGAWTYRLQREEGVIWVLQCLECPTGPDLYAFDLTRHLPVDYEPANHYTSTHPESRFVISVTAQRADREVRQILRNRELLTIRPTSTHVERIETNAELLEVLEVRFGIICLPTRAFRNLPSGAPWVESRWNQIDQIISQAKWRPAYHVPRNLGIWKVLVNLVSSPASKIATDRVTGMALGRNPSRIDD